VTPVEAAFRSNFDAGREVGAALSVFRDGQEIVSLHGGFCDAARTVAWDSSTLVLVWSATKGPASACVLHAMEQVGATLETPVADFWPGFGQAGKHAITFGQALSHRAGLCAVDDSQATLMDHESVLRAVEHQPPLLPPEAGSAYSPRVFSFVLDEMVRRLTDGETLGHYWRRVFAEPLALDFWIGLPEDLHHRVATTLPPKVSTSSSEDDLFSRAFADPQSLTRRAFSSPPGRATISAMNSPQARSASLPGMGGIGSASALAKFYAMLAGGGQWLGHRFFCDETLAWMSTRLVQGFDHVLQRDMAFAAGFMMDPIDASGKKIRHLLGPASSAFGHAGAGGSLGFADPEHKIGFAYVMNQMELGVLPCERCLSLVRALYSEL
jgi:CubicO group peptidase (beta-lactamase class C family)